MIKRIILDVDDVLNSLTLHVMRHYQCDIGPYDYHLFPPEIGYDIIGACDMLGGKVPFVKEKGDLVYDIPAFWNGVTAANLWRTAPKSPQCDLILNLSAQLVGTENVFLATSPTKDPQSHADKLHWVWDNLPTWIHRQYFITPRKWLLGKPGVLLLDDHLMNVERFLEEGGDAFLVPRPWNRAHELDTDSTLIQYLRNPL